MGEPVSEFAIGSLPAPVRLARRMARDVVERGVPAGTGLGALPEVAQRYGISVPTLRKAITYLLDDGIVTMREGRGGGLFVAAPPIESAMRAMHVYLSDRNLSPEQVAEARALVDGAVIERATRFVGNADHERLRPLLSSGDEHAAAIADAEAIEDAILAAARQPILALFSRLMRQLDHDGDVAAPDPQTECDLRQDSARAILAGDLGAALVLWRRRRSLAVAEDPVHDRTARLADRIAVEIQQLIHVRDLQPGDELGREADLQERFAVSRPTLRDAIRILERSGSVKISPGRSGGIFVGAAEPYAAIEMTSLYLSTTRLVFAEQIEARRVVEARAAQLAAERITPLLAAELETAIAADVAAARIPASDWPARGARVERLVARACGNPLIEFFTLVLIELSMNQSEGRAPPSISSADLARLVSMSHAEIVADILARRPVDAAFRTRQYLTHLARWMENQQPIA
ncbi:MAG: GntR family transcriptional regulator [Sphingomonadaceae bacterium]|nr:GntR family transcriptional regulator [Sphingomonadaceae bacterium]